MKHVQSVIFLRTLWSVTAARKWLKTHKYKHNSKVDTTKNFHRFRQFTPKRHGTYRIRALASSGVKLVIEYEN